MVAQRPPGRVRFDLETPIESHSGTLDTIVSRAANPVDRSRGVLSVLSGSEAGRVMSLPPGIVITLGRSDECTYRFNDVSLSRSHAQLMVVDGQYIFHDANSKNGSTVNGTPARTPMPLRDGDRLLLGTGTSLRFALVTEDEERALIRAYEAAMRDGLTGVFNRKHLDERLEAEVAFALRHKTALTVIMVDVDHFKRVNDTYGHQAGDAVLRHVAVMLGSGLRAEDLLARYGGEEFVIVARSIALDAGLVLAERLRQTVAQTPTPLPGSAPLAVTLSAGVASLSCCTARVDRATLIGLADARLYRAKATGRNRVVGPEGDGSLPPPPSGAPLPLVRCSLLGRAAPEQARGELGAEFAHHQLFDHAGDRALVVVVLVEKLDAHAGRAVVGVGAGLHHPLHLAEQAQGGHHAGHREGEDELGAHVERLVGADEGAALRDVFRVIGEKHVEPFVLDLELDGRAVRCASVGGRPAGHGATLPRFSRRRSTAVVGGAGREGRGE
jgi:diguanylate cyclase (GGDEF)-like protein